MATGPDNSVALWVVTPNGMALARRLQEQWKAVSIFYSHALAGGDRPVGSESFVRLLDAVEKNFSRFQHHIFIMATGIVVRAIASQLQHKTVDPAVVVVDDRGRFAISLTSGHLGGANQLAREAAELLKATPVITTATDVNQKPAIDVVAAERRLKIENPECIKSVNMALLSSAPVMVHDPAGWLGTTLPGVRPFSPVGDSVKTGAPLPAAVWVDDTTAKCPPGALVLRPPSLAAGIGCNRNTPKTEIRDFLHSVLEQFGLAHNCLRSIASIDLKSDEIGLCALAADMDLPLHFYTKEELSEVKDVPTPSATITKHVGVPSVCEAAVILASRSSTHNSKLIVPKQISGNVTVAIARRVYISSA